jgi:small GTP-binding protein
MQAGQTQVEEGGQCGSEGDPPGSSTAVATVKVVCLGAEKTGKSSIAVRMATGAYVESLHEPTIEECFKSDQTVNGQRTFFEIIDTAGNNSAEYSSMQESWIRENDSFLLVYSVGDATSFEEVRSLKANIDVLKREAFANAPIGEAFAKARIVLAGSMCDITSAERQVSAVEGQQLANAWGCKFFECSAKESINVKECFQELARLNMQPNPPHYEARGRKRIKHTRGRFLRRTKSSMNIDRNFSRDSVSVEARSQSSSDVLGICGTGLKYEGVCMSEAFRLGAEAVEQAVRWDKANEIEKVLAIVYLSCIAYEPYSFSV